MPLLTADQVTALVVLLKTPPTSVAAHTVDGVAGSTASAVTVRSVSPSFAGDQAPPPLVVWNSPGPPNVPAKTAVAVAASAWMLLGYRPVVAGDQLVPPLVDLKTPLSEPT